MLVRLFTLLFIFISQLSLFGQEQAPVTPLTTVSTVDLEKFMGKWYEVSRLQFPWNASCGHNSTITYTKTGVGSFDVQCQCQTGKNKTDVQVANGKGIVIDTKSYSKFKLTFNYFNSYPWVFSGDYWIIQLAQDYSYAVISNPSEKHIMILSRTPQMSDNLYQNILDTLVLQMPNLNVLNMMRNLQD